MLMMVHIGMILLILAIMYRVYDMFLSTEVEEGGQYCYAHE